MKLVKTYNEQTTLPRVPTVTEGDGNYPIDDIWHKIMCFYKCDREKTIPEVLNEVDYFGVYMSPSLDSDRGKESVNVCVTRELTFLPKQMRLLAAEILKNGAMIEKASAKLLTTEGGEKRLEMSGSPGKGKLIAVPKLAGLEPGMLIWNNNSASYIYSYGSQLMMGLISQESTKLSHKKATRASKPTKALITWLKRLTNRSLLMSNYTIKGAICDNNTIEGAIRDDGTSSCIRMSSR